MPVRIVDLTRTLRHLGPSTRTQPVPMMFPTVTHESTRPRYDGALSIASMGILLSDHAGTHVDAWSHLSDEPGTASIDEMPLAGFTARAVVVDVSDAGRPSATGPAVLDLVDAVLDRAESVEAVLFRTGAVPEPSEDVEGYLEGFRGIGADVIERLAARRVRLVGTDARSLDPAEAEHGADGLPAHRACLQARIVVCENLDLRAAPVETPFTFFALPLKLAGCTGSPVRAVALLDQSREPGQGNHDDTDSPLDRRTGGARFGHPHRTGIQPGDG